MPRHLPALLALPLLAACGADPDPAPGGVTPDEQAALNDAATMLDEDAMATAASNIANETVAQ